jgi:hypothetical protein
MGFKAVFLQKCNGKLRKNEILSISYARCKLNFSRNKGSSTTKIGQGRVIPRFTSSVPLFYSDLMSNNRDI